MMIKTPWLKYALTSLGYIVTVVAAGVLLFELLPVSHPTCRVDPTPGSCDYWTRVIADAPLVVYVLVLVIWPAVLLGALFARLIRPYFPGRKYRLFR